MQSIALMHPLRPQTRFGNNTLSDADLQKQIQELQAEQARRQARESNRRRIDSVENLTVNLGSPVGLWKVTTDVDTGYGMTCPPQLLGYFQGHMADVLAAVRDQKVYDLNFQKIQPQPVGTTPSAKSGLAEIHLKNDLDWRVPDDRRNQILTQWLQSVPSQTFKSVSVKSSSPHNSITLDVSV